MFTKVPALVMMMVRSIFYFVNELIPQNLSGLLATMEPKGSCFYEVLKEFQKFITLSIFFQRFHKYRCSIYNVSPSFIIYRSRF